MTEWVHDHGSQQDHRDKKVICTLQRCRRREWLISRPIANQQGRRRLRQPRTHVAMPAGVADGKSIALLRSSLTPAYRTSERLLCGFFRAPCLVTEDGELLATLRRQCVVSILMLACLIDFTVAMPGPSFEFRAYPYFRRGGRLYVEYVEKKKTTVTRLITDSKRSSRIATRTLTLTLRMRLHLALPTDRRLIFFLRIPSQRVYARNYHRLAGHAARTLNAAQRKNASLAACAVYSSLPSITGAPRTIKPGSCCIVGAM